MVMIINFHCELSELKCMFSVHDEICIVRYVMIKTLRFHIALFTNQTAVSTDFIDFGALL